MSPTLLDCDRLDRLVMFLSADTFIPYWKLLAEQDFPEADQDLICASARNAVDDFMAGETVFWNIDFSQLRLARTREIFGKGLMGLSDRGRRLFDTLTYNYCSDKSERRNIAYAMNFMSRVARDPGADEAGILQRSDCDIIAACMASAEDVALSLAGVENEWLDASGEWDSHLRGLTPDLPEYLFLDLAGACEERSELPAFLNNLSLLLELQQRRLFIAALTDAIAASFPPGSGLGIPKLLQPRAGEKT